MTEARTVNSENISFPKNRSRMTLGGVNGILIEMPSKRPNCFWRIMQYLILGLKWEKL